MEVKIFKDIDNNKFIEFFKSSSDFKNLKLKNNTFHESNMIYIAIIIDKFIRKNLTGQGFYLEDSFYYYQVESCDKSYFKVNEIAKEIYATKFIPSI